MAEDIKGDVSIEGQKCAWADPRNMDTMFYYWNKEEEDTPKITVRGIPDSSRFSRPRNKNSDDASLEKYKSFGPAKFDWRKFGTAKS
ncbi:hypothetical protein Daus18300_002848 [Diaporthe australafricana]|uniref:Uncharacterized protein n=1 Tax=Diaporthe australafricana TaxID=127596 RepID=A0ABR3XJS4_9PEZI